MGKKGKKHTSTGAARMVAGVLVALVGVVGAAGVALSARKPQQGAAPSQGAPKAGAGVGGPALTTDGRTVDVGMVSQIPQARGYDTGAVDYTYNRPGWDYAVLGGRQ